MSQHTVTLQSFTALNLFEFGFELIYFISILHIHSNLLLIFKALQGRALCSNHSTNTVPRFFGNSAVQHISLCRPNGLALLICFGRYDKQAGNLRMGPIFKRNGNEKGKKTIELGEVHCEIFWCLVCWQKQAKLQCRT